MSYFGEEKMTIVNQENQIYWDKSGLPTREAVCELLGWCTKKEGKITRMGKRIAKTNWDNLTGCARNILIRAGIRQ